MKSKIVVTTPVTSQEYLDRMMEDWMKDAGDLDRYITYEVDPGQITLYFRDNPKGMAFRLKRTDQEIKNSLETYIILGQLRDHDRDQPQS